MHDRTISRLRRRLGGLLVLKYLLAWLSAWAFLWGTVVVACRVSRNETPEWLFWGLSAAALVAATALVRGLRQVPASSSLRALVDRTSACGGLLMTADETALGPWDQRLPEPAELHVRWRGGRSWAIFTAAAAFLLVSFLFPQRLATWAEEGLEIGGDVVQLVHKVEVLKEENVLDQKRAEHFKERLEQLERDSAGRNPAKTLEALDHVRDQLARAAQKAAEAAVKKSENLGKAESLADGIKKTAGDLDSRVEKEALAELAALVQQAALETNLLDMHLDPELLKQLKASKLSPAELAELMKSLGSCKGELKEKLKKLHRLKLIDVELLKACDKAGECDCAAALLACKGGMCVADALSKRGGRGGVSEGPGHNEIAWTDGTKEEGAKFKEEVLPPGSLADLKKSLVMGVGRADPKSGEVQTSQAGGLQRSAGGGEANTTTLLPQHRGAVERFFLRSEKK